MNNFLNQNPPKLRNSHWNFVIFCSFHLIMTRRQEEQGLKMLLMAFAVAACCTVEARKTSRKPHIIIMLADDMVSYSTNQILRQTLSFTRLTKYNYTEEFSTNVD